MKRLSQPSGITIMTDQAIGPVAAQSPLKSIVKRAILVHSGPNGSPIFFCTGDYDPEKDGPDGDISFDDARIKNIVKCHNEMISQLAVGYNGFENMPIGAFPPILDQHEGTDSVNRVVGRLNSLLSFEIMDIPGVGQNCSCVVSYITFLGEKTVEQVQDGRIYHLSIGIDENTDTLGETSVVITPAAPGAMLLKRGTNKSSSGDKQMDVKKLEAKKAKMAKLEAMKKELAGMTSKATITTKKINLSKKVSSVTAKLSGLVQGGKITPAEFKKMDMKALAGLPEEAFKTLVSAFEAMEPKVLAGQRGSTSAIDYSTLGKEMHKKDMKSLKSEIKGDFKKMGKKLKASDDDEDEGKEDKKDMSANPFDKEDDKKDMAGDEGKEDDKKALEVSPLNAAENEENSSELQKQVDELNTQIARLAGMVQELMDCEKEEGHDLEGAVDEDSADLAEVKDEDKKDLGAETAAVEEKKDLAEDDKSEDKKDLAEDDKEDKKDLGSDDKKEDDKKDLAEDDKSKDDEKKLQEETKKALSKAKKKKG